MPSSSLWSSASSPCGDLRLGMVLALGVRPGRPTPSSPRSCISSGRRARQNSSKVASWIGMSSGFAVSTERSAVLNSCRSARSTASAVRIASMTSEGVTSSSRSRSSRQKSMMLRWRSVCRAVAAAFSPEPRSARDQLLVECAARSAAAAVRKPSSSSRQLAHDRSARARPAARRRRGPSGSRRASR